jgi:hypothetical protein
MKTVEYGKYKKFCDKEKLKYKISVTTNALLCFWFFVIGYVVRRV